jgi:hypothetical protein
MDGPGLPLVENDGPETGDLALAPAQFAADATRRNYWWLRERRTQTAEEGMLSELSQTVYGDPNAWMSKGTPDQVEKLQAEGMIGAGLQRQASIDTLFADVGKLQGTMPGEFANLPPSHEALKAQAEANARREIEAELADYDSTIANRSDPNLLGGASAFVGSMAAGVSDVEGVATLPLAINPANLGRSILLNGKLGGGMAALDLPGQNRMADFLGEERPDPLANILMGAGFGAALPIAGRAVHLGVNAFTPAGRIANRELLGFGTRADATAAERGAANAIARDEATAGTTPEGMNPDDHAARVEAAEAALQADMTVRAEDVIPDMTPAAPSAPASAFDVKLSARDPATVEVLDSTAGKTRDKPVSDTYLEDVRTAVALLGDDIGVRIVSGGQDPAGTPGGQRTGSTRHDVDHTGHAHTADLVLTRNGKDVLPGEDPELYARFLYQAAKTFPGIGHYEWGVHIGGGSRAAWGPDTTAATLDPYFGEAIRAGRDGTGTPGTPPQFDYEPGGNAAPDANLVGYVTGKLIEGGMEPHIAFAFVGNFMAESGKGLNTGAIGDNGNAFGMAQWNDRAPALKAFADARGTDWRDVDTQIAFVFHELETTEAAAWAAIKDAPDAATAARLVSERYERPGTPHLSSRMAYARMLEGQWASGKVPQGGSPGRWRDPGDDAMAGGVVNFDPRDIETDALSYQYKSGGDDFGVTDRLRGERQWDAMAAAGVIVHERMDGSRYIADGHQRFGLARRLMDQGQNDIVLQGFLLKEIDGFSIEETRALAALRNIRQESGTPLDAAKIIRDNPELVAQVSRGRNFMAQAQSLADLAPGPFQAIVNDVIPQNYGAIVGRVIPDDDRLQGVAIAALKKADPANETQAESIARDIRRLGLEKRAADDQLSLFGDGFDLRDTVISERARIIDRVMKEARTDRTLFSRLEQQADVIEEAGNVLNRTENTTRAEAAERALARLLILADQPGTVRDALDVAARDLRAGKPLDAAARDVWQALGRGPDADQAGRLADGSDSGGAARAALDPLPPTNLLDLPPTSDAIIEPGLFDDIETPAEAARLDGLNRQLSSRLTADPEFDLALPTGPAGADGKPSPTISLRALMDDLNEEADFVDALKHICLTKG